MQNNMLLYHLSPHSDLISLKPAWGKNPDGSFDSAKGVYLCSAKYIEFWRDALAETRGKNLYLYQIEVPPAKQNFPVPFPGFFDRFNGEPWSGGDSPEVLWESTMDTRWIDELPCELCKEVAAT